MHVPEALRTNHDAILGALGRHHLWSGYVHNWDDPWFDEVVAAILVLVGEKPLVYISASGSAAEIPDGSHEHLAVHVITDGALIVVSVGPADDTGAREISTRAVP
ncbi:hypothetical protein GCM10009774_33210 [Cellulomonas gelida]|uniref:Uncharacterized protein n=1 Tax=Cellulomonas gelida TaxID=1712 RepID=A0A4Y3KLI7_9CELL|nr:hypothetical protein [Cellulomonas gelida]GEA84837.1 hypothetical protein CGE01nite_20880 [Cellulomonas gelida]GGL39871.1 hypothetical protein GCM10009774_33210 [Cellulomonas gelida]